MQRAGCAGAVAGVVAVSLWRPVEVGAGAGQSEHVCALIGTFLDVAFVGISPPPDATDEDLQAVTRVNTRLSQLGETIRESEAMRKLGC